MPKKQISAKRKKKPASNKMYFTKNTENAIIRFNQSLDVHEREQIYRNHIEKPLDKLAENVINRFKFPYVNQSFEDTKREVVSFLVINLHKFKPDKGKKAFSYLSVIAKNHLIYNNTNGYKEEKRNLYLSETDDYIPIENMVMLEAPSAHEHDDSKEFVRLMIDFWEKNIPTVFKKKRDAAIANAVIELFRRANGIENFNKKALFLMIREMTDYKTNYITKVVNKMRAYTTEHLQEFYSEGVIGNTTN